MATKLYIQNNYLVVQEGTDTPSYIPSKDVDFQPQKNNPDVIVIHNIEVNGEAFTFASSDAQDESGTPIGTTAQVIEFLTANTGFSSSAGGSAEAIMAVVSQYTGFAAYTDDVHVDAGSAFTVPANTDVIFPLNAGILYDEQMPIDVETFYYHGKINLTSITGTFEKGETITGGTSTETAIVLFAGDTYLLLRKVSGDFTDTETVTGGTSGATATVDGATEGPRITGRNGDNLDLMLYFKCIPSVNSQKLDIWIDIGGSVGELYRDTKDFSKSIGEVDSVLYALPSAYTRDTFENFGGIIYIRSANPFDLFAGNLNVDRSHRARIIS